MVSECPDYPDYCKCSDTLQRGAERLANHLKDEGLPVDMADCWGEFIAADPGIQALVEFAERFKDYPSRDGTAALAALHKWEQGDACARSETSP